MLCYIERKLRMISVVETRTPGENWRQIEFLRNNVGVKW